jgi:hypothetical protein
MSPYDKLYVTCSSFELTRLLQNWGIAHRLLMPIFGPIGIRKVCGCSIVQCSLVNMPIDVWWNDGHRLANASSMGPFRTRP